MFNPIKDDWEAHRYTIPEYMQHIVNVNTMHYPQAWYLGIYQYYLMRPNDRLKNIIQATKTLLGITQDTKYSCLHIRHTDKLTWKESEEFVTREYVRELDHFLRPGIIYHNVYDKEKVANVFVATDDPAVIESLGGFSHYNFMYNVNSTNSASKGKHMERFKDLEGMDQALADLDILSRCEYFVGTFSSQFGRLVFELMAMYHDNPGAHAMSLDETWYGRV